MPEYKLHYFEARGRAEPTRLCFAAAGVKYEDIRYSWEEWKLKKSDDTFLPMELLPMLEVDDKKLNESLAIMRYAARECGLCPSDSFDVAKCDMIVDALSDVYSKYYPTKFENDEEKKKRLRKEYDEKILPTFLRKMTALLKSNSDGQGYFVGQKLTYADISMFTLGDQLSEEQPSLLDSYPEVKNNYIQVRDAPGIKEWLQTRPKTKM